MVIFYISCVILGLIAGFSCGIAGLTATFVAAPLMIAAGIPAYQAVGICLATDVVSSASATITYARKGHVRLKRGLLMLGVILVFTFIGSWLGYLLPEWVLGNGITGITIIVGIGFIFFPSDGNTPDIALFRAIDKHPTISICVGGAIVGLICGTIGVGGGMLVLIMLTYVLGYPMKDALGTSMLITIFVAGLGASSHFLIGDMPNIISVICIAASAFFGAKMAAVVAEKVKSKTLSRIIGCIMVIVGIASFIIK